MSNVRIRHFAALSVVVAALSLSGCATQQMPASVADTIAASPQLSTLSGLVAKAGVTETMNSGGPFTVFAPTNEAFAKVPDKIMDDLSKNPDRLKAVLTYHVLTSKVMSAEVKNSNVKTVNGANLAVSKAGQFVTVEDAVVQKADVSATNGVVHIVDSVLIPPPK